MSITSHTATTHICPRCEGRNHDDGDPLLTVPERFRNGAPYVGQAAVCRGCWSQLGQGEGPLDGQGGVLLWGDELPEGRGEHDRQYLDGRPISCGTQLEMYMGDGRWWPVRYEVEHRGVDPGRTVAPVLHLGRPKDHDDKRSRREFLGLIEDYYVPSIEVGVLRPAKLARFRWP